MIGRLHGKLVSKHPPQVLVDVGGVAYDVDVPMSTFFNLPATGAQVTLHTHLHVREDAQVLYGFATLEERAAFRELIRISGVGARTALAVLSGMSVADLAHAIAAQEAGRLVKVPGIGKKTAERLLLELKGRLAEPLPGAGGFAPAGGDAADILNALVALGYSEKEAAAAIKGLAPGLGVTEGIRAALKALAKS
jgi:Holliday junction DNA helicase RuvA